MKPSLALLCCAVLFGNSSCREPGRAPQAIGNGPDRARAALHDSVRAWKPDDGRIAVIYVAPGECTKCDLVASHAISWIRDHAPGTKIVALVKCRRPVELAMYSRTNDHVDYAAMDRRGLWAELGGGSDSRMLVFDSDGHLSGNIKSRQFFGNTDSVLAGIFASAR